MCTSNQNRSPNTLLTGDALDILKTLDTDSVDAVVTDPPYGISIVGLDWDRNVPGVQLWREALRVLKPGGHLIAFAGSRTYHQMANNIEKAGFEIRDQVMWLYGSGFPHSHNIALAIKKKHGANKAIKWHGWGTTLKPAHEPIVLARKPFNGSVADNVLAFGTGGLNIDRCRVLSDSTIQKKDKKKDNVVSLNNSTKGRFPANVVHAGINTPWAPYFYCAKPSTAERDCGLGKFKLKPAHERTEYSSKNNIAHHGATGSARNFHPTVKPIALMEHLITLVTPEGGCVLDPFTGSGTTLIAARNLGFSYIGIEKSAEFVRIAKARLAA